MSRARLLLWAAAATALILAARHIDAAACLRQALSRIEAAGAWAPALFIAAYAAAAVLLVPGSLLTLAAGVLFGVLRGSVYASLGSTAGAAAAFLVGRHAARRWVADRVSGDPRFRAIDEAVGREGFKIVLLTRLTPVFPFIVLNYAFGLTSVPFGRYVLASWIGMLPATVAFVYAGALAGDLAGLGAGAGRPPAYQALALLGLAATAALAAYAARLARRVLKEDLGPRSPG